MKELIYINAIELQKILEVTLKGLPIGTCHLIGYCLSEIYKKQGFKSRLVSGKQALLINNSKKYVKYGNSELKGTLVGHYHTWCEVEFNGEIYIVDPSLKYNRLGVRKLFKIKTSQMIPDILMTNLLITHYYKYYEDCKLENQSNYHLNKVPKYIKDTIIQNTIEKVNFLQKNKVA